MRLPSWPGFIRTLTLCFIAAGVVTSLIAGGIVGLFVMRYRDFLRHAQFGPLNGSLFRTRKIL
jgi:hypothetical protein